MFTLIICLSFSYDALRYFLIHVIINASVSIVAACFAPSR